MYTVLHQVNKTYTINDWKNDLKKVGKNEPGGIKGLLGVSKMRGVTNDQKMIKKYLVMGFEDFGQNNILS